MIECAQSSVDSLSKLFARDKLKELADKVVAQSSTRMRKYWKYDWVGTSRLTLVMNELLIYTSAELSIYLLFPDPPPLNG